MSAQLAINRGESVPCLYIFHVPVSDGAASTFSAPLLIPLPQPLPLPLPSLACLLIYRVFCVVAHINHKADTRRFTHVWRLADADADTDTDTDATAPRRQAKATTRTTAK